MSLGAMTSLPALPTVRYAPACTLQGNNVIVAGGQMYPKIFQVVEKLDLK